MATEDLVLAEGIQELLQRVTRIEAAMEVLVSQRLLKDWYATDEAAEILEKAPFTVREWCRLGRIRAEKRACGRGSTREWMISREELERIQNHGLLPVPSYRHPR